VRALSRSDFFQTNEDRFLNEIIEVLRIPSVSTDPVHKGDLVAMAEWIVERMTRIGVPTVELVETAGHPIVEGRWTVDEARKTLLVYGHYDVQPVDPIELWESGPFDADIRDGKIFARGSADMKINLVTFLQALDAIVTEQGQPPLNLVFLFEGEEEIGSSNLKRFLVDNADRLACDAVLSLDSGFPAVGVPGFFVALKGGAGGQIDLRTGETDLHSGGYGAAVPNANQLMAKLAATFHTPDGKVAIEGFYDRVIDMTDADRAEIAYSASVMQDVREEAGVYTLWGEEGYAPYERIGARPTLDINGMWGGFTGEGAKTVTPCEAHLKLTCRLVPNQDPDEINELIKAHIAKHIPEGVQATYNARLSMSGAYSIPRDNWALQRAASVMSDVYGIPPVFFRTGGSVPITHVFKQALGAETVSLGFFQPGSPIHAPNEWFRLEDIPMARMSYAAVLDALGEG
jgi:acetylornithine deacetylase/succinyl-diaminopimelate desuccinylase-like protein